MSGEEGELTTLADHLHRRLLDLRHESGSPPIPRSPLLDRLAHERAARIADLPEAHRQLAGPDPIGAFLAREDLREYRRVGEHLDLKKGFEDLEEAFAYTWVSKPEVRALATDAAMDSVGIGLVRSQDGWVILVGIFLQEFPSAPRDPGALEREALRLINQIRRDEGLGELRESPELSRVAREHSRNMAEKGYFAHVDRNGKAAVDRVREAGILYRSLAENIQFNNASEPARVAVEEWLRSPGHRRNILTGSFRFTGMGVAVDGEGGVYFTQLFLDPPRLRLPRAVTAGEVEPHRRR